MGFLICFMTAVRLRKTVLADQVDHPVIEEPAIPFEYFIKGTIRKKNKRL